MGNIIGWVGKDWLMVFMFIGLYVNIFWVMGEVEIVGVVCCVSFGELIILNWLGFIFLSFEVLIVGFFVLLDLEIDFCMWCEDDFEMDVEDVWVGFWVVVWLFVFVLIFGVVALVG